MGNQEEIQRTARVADEPTVASLPEAPVELQEQHLSVQREGLNVVDGDERTGLLSNFAAAPFELDGVRFASTEAFVQYIKFPPDHEKKARIPELEGPRARRAGSKVNKINYRKLEADEPVHVYWKGEEIPYRSEAHLQLLERGIRAKLAQNPQAAQQLLDTGDTEFYHDTGHPENPFTSLPGEVFCKILMIARDDLRSGKLQSE